MAPFKKDIFLRQLVYNQQFSILTIPLMNLLRSETKPEKEETKIASAIKSTFRNLC